MIFSCPQFYCSVCTSDPNIWISCWAKRSLNANSRCFATQKYTRAKEGKPRGLYLILWTCCVTLPLTAHLKALGLRESILESMSHRFLNTSFPSKCLGSSSGCDYSHITQHHWNTLLLLLSLQTKSTGIDRRKKCSSSLRLVGMK